MVRKNKKHNKNKDDEEFDDSETVIKGNEMDIDHDEELEKKDLPRTREKKALFLKLYPKFHLIAATTCREVGIAQKTFYGWLNDDQEFADAVDKAKLDINKRVVDILMHKITVEKETRAITYFLDRKHPEYKPTSKTEVVTGSKTLEDILKADEEKGNGNFANTNKADGDSAGVDNEGGASSPGPEVPTGETPKDQGQTGEAPAVSSEQDSSVLLEEKDKKESDSQSTPEGNLEDNRRRPIDRLRTKRN